MTTVTKIYRDLPAAHRQPNHDGHCALVHGHNWTFEITFACDELDECGFVVDVGKLGWVKDLLGRMFDHTLLINETDPHQKLFLEREDLFDVRIVKDCSMEGLAQLVHGAVNNLLDRERGLQVIKVVCWEDSKNGATYET